MELKDIKKLVELMKDHELTKFELEEEGFRIALARGSSDDIKMVTPLPHPHAHMPVPAAPAASASAAPGAAAVPAADVDDGSVEIPSPIVGTFYRSSSPDSEPLAAVGQKISKDSVVCIVEAMKVMNEIKADVSGVITEILVENATPVMFGQALFKVKPQ